MNHHKKGTDLVFFGDALNLFVQEKKDLLSDGLLDSVGISPKMFYLLFHMFSFNIKADIAQFILRRLIRGTIKKLVNHVFGALGVD